jgi:hypothetical protein
MRRQNGCENEVKKTAPSIEPKKKDSNTPLTVMHCVGTQMVQRQGLYGSDGRTQENKGAVK